MRAPVQFVMPLRFHISPDHSIGVSQTFDSPSVYLDHWAIRLLSDDLALQERFVSALRHAGGTLLLSHLTFAEFAAVEDSATCDRGEAFLSKVLPNVYFAEFNIDKARQQEDAQPPLAVRPKLAPPPDPQMMRAFAVRYSLSLPFAMTGFIAEVHQNRGRMETLVRDVNSRIADKLVAQRTDAAFVSAARNTPVDNGRQPTTLVMGELMRDFVLDSTSSISANDAMDLQHATVSLAYCDYVLLDGKFADKARRMKERISRANMSMRLAACYSKRDAGLQRFLSSLESWS